MSARTTMTTGWRIRLGGIAILFAAMGCWFLYDGLIGYPSQQAIVDEFIVYRGANEESNPNWQDEWDTVAETKGYPTVKWRDPEDKWYENLAHDSSAIMTQLLFAGFAVPLALWFGFLWVKSGKRWIESDDKGVNTESGQQADWDQMVKLDKRRWPKKGIAVLHYVEDAADATAAREAAKSESDTESSTVTKRITLDDWKFEPASTKAIVMAIEENLGKDLIIGDITEAERDAKKAAAAENSDATEQSSNDDDVNGDGKSDDAGDGERVEDDAPERVA